MCSFLKKEEQEAKLKNIDENNKKKITFYQNEKVRTLFYPNFSNCCFKSKINILTISLNKNPSITARRNVLTMKTSK